MSSAAPPTQTFQTAAQHLNAPGQAPRGTTPVFILDQFGNPINQPSVGTSHNADNQPLPNFSQLTESVSLIVNPLGQSSRQLEVGADAQASHGIMSSSNNLRQTQSSPATGNIFAGQTTNAFIVPAVSTSGMQINTEIDVDLNSPNQETGYIIGILGNTLIVQPQNGSPSAPTWKNNHLGTYKIQVGAYNVMRDILGEGSGFRGDGMPPAVEVEWNAGGPPLASGLPSLAQYDRETLLSGQGPSDFTTINSTNVGDMIITLAGAKATLTPRHPIRLSGAAIPETVYTDQSYQLGNNTVIVLQNPVVNAGQVLATWQRYSPNGPGTSNVLMYGEGMEGIALNNPGAPGFVNMMQANADNIGLITAVASTGVQVSPDQQNPNWRGAKLYINLTAISGGSLVVTLFGKDPFANVYYPMQLASVPLQTPGFSVLSVHPGLFTVPGVSLDDFLPRTWRVVAAPNGGTIATYTVSCCLVM